MSEQEQLNIEITNAEVIYTYSTYYLGPCVARDILAKIFLLKKLTKVVYDSDGYFYYLKDDEFIKGDSTITLSPDTSVGVFNLRDWPNDAFSRENLYENQINKYFEKKLLDTENKYIDNEYIRFSLDQIKLLIENLQIHLYPIVTLYASGSLIVEYKCIINQKISYDSFLHSFLRLNQKTISKVFSNRTLSELSYYHNKMSTTNIETSIDDNSDFKFDLYNFNLDDELNKTLSTLALSIFTILIDTLNFNEKATFFSLGKNWSMRLDVHIIKFEKQPKTTTTIMNIYNDLIQSMLFNIDLPIPDYYKKEKLTDLRHFEDYIYFFTKGISLTIWSKNGLLNNKVESDINFYHIVSSTQILNRYFSYYDMLFEKPIEVINQCDDYESILQYQEDFCLLEKDDFCSSHYGEIEDDINYAKQVMKIEKKKETAKEFLELRKTRMENKKEQFFNKTTLALTVLFGLLSSSALSTDLIRPMWNFFNFPRSKNKQLNSIIAFLLAIVIVMFIIIWILKITGKKRVVKMEDN